MKIKEAREIYGQQLKEYQEQKNMLAKERAALEKQMGESAEGKDAFAKEAATLELSFNAISDKYDEYQKYLMRVQEVYSSTYNAEVAKQQGKSYASAAKEMAKALEVSRRIANGDKVASSDEQKLMDYSMELYMAAKNMAILNEMKNKKEDKAIWGDEEVEEAPDPDEVASEKEMIGTSPEIADVSEIIEAANVEIE